MIAMYWLGLLGRGASYSPSTKISASWPEPRTYLRRVELCFFPNSTRLGLFQMIGIPMPQPGDVAARIADLIIADAKSGVWGSTAQRERANCPRRAQTRCIVLEGAHQRRPLGS